MRRTLILVLICSISLGLVLSYSMLKSQESLVLCDDNFDTENEMSDYEKDVLDDTPFCELTEDSLICYFFISKSFISNTSFSFGNAGFSDLPLLPPEA